jgi:hypothetical protein
VEIRKITVKKRDGTEKTLRSDGRPGIAGEKSVY